MEAEMSELNRRDKHGCRRPKVKRPFGRYAWTCPTCHTQWERHFETLFMWRPEIDRRAHWVIEVAS
jgi:hypothetical protein